MCLNINIYTDLPRAFEDDGKGVLGLRKNVPLEPALIEALSAIISKQPFPSLFLLVIVSERFMLVVVTTVWIPFFFFVLDGDIRITQLHNICYTPLTTARKNHIFQTNRIKCHPTCRKTAKSVVMFPPGMVVLENTVNIPVVEVMPVVNTITAH